MLATPINQQPRNLRSLPSGSQKVCAPLTVFSTMREMETRTPEGLLYDNRLKDDSMALYHQMRSLKVHLSDEEFRTLHIATTLSPYETQSEFIAATMLAAADNVINHWRRGTAGPDS